MRQNEIDCVLLEEILTWIHFGRNASARAGYIFKSVRALSALARTNTHTHTHTSTGTDTHWHWHTHYNHRARHFLPADQSPRNGIVYFICLFAYSPCLVVCFCCLFYVIHSPHSAASHTRTHMHTLRETETTSAAANENDCFSCSGVFFVFLLFFCAFFLFNFLSILQHSA